MADSVEIVDATAVAEPATRVVEAVGSQGQHGLEIAVPKVEYAPSETRVHVQVTNNAASEASVYPFSSSLVEGTTQHETEFSSLPYPELPSDILPGTVAEAIWVFPALDPNTEARLVVDGRTLDFSLDFLPYEFVIPAP